MHFNPSIRNQARNTSLGRRIRGVSLTAAAALFCLGLAAAPASASGEFKDGFEDQLGRLLAVHAFHVGKVALLAGHVSNQHWNDDRHRYDDRRDSHERAVYRDRRGDRRHHKDRDRRLNRRHRRGHDVQRVEYHFHDSQRRPCASRHGAPVHADELRHRRLGRDEQRAYQRWLRQERRHR